MPAACTTRRDGRYPQFYSRLVKSPERTSVIGPKLGWLTSLVANKLTPFLRHLVLVIRFYSVATMKPADLNPQERSKNSSPSLFQMLRT